MLGDILSHIKETDSVSIFKSVIQLYQFLET